MKRVKKAGIFFPITGLEEWVSLFSLLVFLPVAPGSTQHTTKSAHWFGRQASAEYIFNFSIFNWLQFRAECFPNALPNAKL